MLSLDKIIKKGIKAKKLNNRKGIKTKRKMRLK